MIIINNDKLNSINLNGNNFAVVMDFDRTLTTNTSLGSWGILENPDFINPNFSIESKALIDKYYPIELDYTLSDSEKSIYMQEWYSKNMNLFYKYDLTYDILINCVKNANLHLRDGVKEYFKYLYDLNVPVVILSAGIGNVIEEYLKLNNCLFSNIYIKSNFIKFENNKMVKFDDLIIHSSNKSINSLLDNIKNNFYKKDFILLFGDLIEDLNMVNKNDLYKTLSFGFLENNVDANISFYKNAFDIVLTDNSSFFDVQKILDKIK